MKQNFEHMKTQFNGWAPAIREKIFGLVEGQLDAYVWQMLETKPAQWVSGSGKVALLGDAAHGFTPCEFSLYPNDCALFDMVIVIALPTMRQANRNLQGSGRVARWP